MRKKRGGYKPSRSYRWMMFKHNLFWRTIGPVLERRDARRTVRANKRRLRKARRR